jgi:hypothetical protein
MDEANKQTSTCQFRRVSFFTKINKEVIHSVRLVYTRLAFNKYGPKKKETRRYEL